MLVCCLIDIDECKTNNVCQHKCANRKGNFVCKCFKGYQLMDDDRSCEGKNYLIVFSSLEVIVIIESFILLYCFISDIDECAVDNGGCDESCINTNGSYSCQCSSGLRLSSDKKSCGCELE